MKEIFRAASFAAEAHKKQTRKDANSTPYINHPLRVAELLIDSGVTDEATIIAALLHDTIEDTNVTVDELIIYFGTEVADLVLECSDDKSLSKSMRKKLQIEHTPFISDKAKLIKIADKIDNMTDILENPPLDWSLQLKLKYFDWARDVVAGARGVNTNLDESFDRMYLMRDWLK